MKFGKRDKSIVDILFILALFGVFLICALFIVLFGAKIYGNTVKNSKAGFNSRTSLAYITEKIRQHDNSNGIEIIEQDGDTTIKLSQNINGRDIVTYMYCYDNQLMEYTTNAGNDLNKQFGTFIMDLSEFNVEKREDRLYHFSLTDMDGNNTEFFVSMYSELEGGKDEE